MRDQLEQLLLLHIATPPLPLITPSISGSMSDCSFVPVSGGMAGTTLKNTFSWNAVIMAHDLLDVMLVKDEMFSLVFFCREQSMVQHIGMEVITPTKCSVVCLSRTPTALACLIVKLTSIDASVVFNEMQPRYISSFASTFSVGDVLWYPLLAYVLDEEHWPPSQLVCNTLLSDTIQLSFSFCLQFNYSWGALHYKPPWPPPVQCVIQIDAVVQLENNNCPLFSSSCLLLHYDLDIFLLKAKSSYFLKGIWKLLQVWELWVTIDLIQAKFDGFSAIWDEWLKWQLWPPPVQTDELHLYSAWAEHATLSWIMWAEFHCQWLMCYSAMVDLLWWQPIIELNFYDFLHSKLVAQWFCRSFHCLLITWIFSLLAVVQILLYYIELSWKCVDDKCLGRLLNVAVLQFHHFASIHQRPGDGLSLAAPQWQWLNSVGCYRWESLFSADDISRHSLLFMAVIFHFQQVKLAGDNTMGAFLYRHSEVFKLSSSLIVVYLKPNVISARQSKRHERSFNSDSFTIVVCLSYCALLAHFDIGDLQVSCDPGCLQFLHQLEGKSDLKEGRMTRNTKDELKHGQTNNTWLLADQLFSKGILSHHQAAGPV